MRFHITIMRPREEKGRFYVQAFHEVAETLAYGLSALGHDASFRSNGFVLDAQNIVLGPQFAAADVKFPPGTILYNLEQIGANPIHMIMPELREGNRIWDYSPTNMPYWQEHGIDADYVPIGYVPQMTRIKPAIYPDIDVLFFGGISPRRAKILRELELMTDIKTKYALGYGSERDAAIARSKVVLNMHFYDAVQLYEQVRVSYLLSNRKCVVSEDATDYPNALDGAMRVVPYDELAAACRELVHNTEERLRLQNRGYELFSKFRERDILRLAIAHLEKPPDKCENSGEEDFHIFHER